MKLEAEKCHICIYFWGGGQVWEVVCERECQIHVLLQRFSVLTGFINEMDPTCQLLHCKKQRKAGVLVSFSFPYFPQPSSIYFEFRLINLGSKQF